MARLAASSTPFGTATRSSSSSTTSKLCPASRIASSRPGYSSRTTPRPCHAGTRTKKLLSGRAPMMFLSVFGVGAGKEHRQAPDGRPPLVCRQFFKLHEYRDGLAGLDRLGDPPEREQLVSPDDRCRRLRDPDIDESEALDPMPEVVPLVLALDHTK